MKKSKPNEKSALQRQTVYSFGDNYYFRKELKILNLLTGYRNHFSIASFLSWIAQQVRVTDLKFMLHRYIFLVDKFGRIRWQGFGMAAEEELASLLSCTTLLLEEKWDDGGVEYALNLFKISNATLNPKFFRAASIIMAFLDSFPAILACVALDFLLLSFAFLPLILKCWWSFWQPVVIVGTSNSESSPFLRKQEWNPL